MKKHNGLYLLYSYINQAYFLMWHETVLMIGSKKDMEYEYNILV